MTKEPKLEAAVRIVPEWQDYDQEIKQLQHRFQEEKEMGALYRDKTAKEASREGMYRSLALGRYFLACLVSVAETGNYDMCSVYDTGSQVNISFMYEEYNESDAVKMFVITFEHTGEAEYPTIKVTNLAGTFLKSVADVVVIENDGDNDLTEKDVMGDADLNGYITAADARLALRYSSKLETFSDRQLRLSDVNYDGKVNSADARLILRVAAGLATDF